MRDRSGLEALLDADQREPKSKAHTAFPRTAGALLDRLGSLYGLRSELERGRRAIESLPVVPVETSVSLRPGEGAELRVTLGVPPRPGDPHGRSALVAALSGLGSERVSTAAADALSSVAPSVERRGLARFLALRARRDEPPRPRAATWLGGETAGERSARVAKSMLGLGLDQAAALHQRLAARLTGNPFNAVIPYGLGFDLGPDRALAAKTYFSCEWVDVATRFLSGRLAEELRLYGLDGFGLLAASARADRRRGRWLLEVSFELPADPARDVRAKAYLPASRLASNEAEGHTAVLRLAAELGFDPLPYEKLVEAVRPDGFTPERPCSQMVGMSASALGPSLEIYLFDPARRRSGSPPGRRGDATMSTRPPVASESHG